jgi:hypothetical protein
MIMVGTLSSISRRLMSLESSKIARRMQPAFEHLG